MDKTVADYLDRFNVSEAARRFLADAPLMLIDGRFVAAGNGATHDVHEPSTEGLITQVPAATPDDVDRAVAAANRAFAGWSRCAPKQREQVLLKLADLVEQHAQTLAEIETLDNGKAIAGCLALDVGGSVDVLRYMAGWATKIQGATRTLSAPGETFAMTLKEPIGVVAAIVPWNWPLNMAVWKIAAPLAVGCTVVLKTAQLTPLSMLYLARLAVEAGVPPGVLNVLTGSGSRIGDALVSHSGVHKVSFTGSTEVGRQVGRKALDHMARVTLELGGKSPMVVFDDADIERVVQATQDSIFFNTGQVCSGGSRLYVQRGAYARVVEAIAERASRMVIGPGLDPAPSTRAGLRSPDTNSRNATRSPRAAHFTCAQSDRRAGPLPAMTSRTSSRRSNDIASMRWHMPFFSVTRRMGDRDRQSNRLPEI
jgi:phenylacetaldehyde dehydrogenase